MANFLFLSIQIDVEFEEELICRVFISVDANFTDPHDVLVSTPVTYATSLIVCMCASISKSIVRKD